MPNHAPLERLRAVAEAARDDFLADLEHIVNIDSGSYTKPGVDAVADVIADRLESLGASVERHAGGRSGDTIVGSFADPGGGPQVLLLGHMDTVFEPGTAAARPFVIRGDRASGPGICDMKGGLLVGIHALRALRAVADSPGTGWLPVGRLIFIANSDEEIGSPSSERLIREHASHSDAALVLEAARPNGDIVSSRKGQMDVRVDIVGRAAHSGVEPELGRSAVVEAAHQVIAIDALDRQIAGATVNTGVVRGGTRPNIVADEASIEIDVRAEDRAHLEDIEAAIRRIAAAPTVPDVQARVEVTARQWPMRKTAASARLVEHAIGVAAASGYGLNDTATGGSSDANTIAAMGIPTIDGLGPVGGRDHSPNEYIELESVVQRTALLAGLLVAIGHNAVE